MTSFLGIEVLETAPNRVDGESVTQRLSRLEVDPGTGARALIFPSSQPGGSRGLEFLCMDLAEVADLRSFVERSFGMAEPFWVPSWQRDLVVSGPCAQGAPLEILACSYSALTFPAGRARRQLQLLGPARVTANVRVVGATASEDGVTEMLTVIGPGGAPGLPLAVDQGWLAMFLRLVRLDDDATLFEWLGPVCTVRLRVTELPLEVPE